MTGCSRCGAELSVDLTRATEHTEDCPIGKRRAYLDDVHNPLGVGALIAASQDLKPRERVKNARRR